MDNARQSPEQFLKEIEKEEQNKKRGHLKIFFGYAAGVGKTYAMLKAAHAARRRGVDVVAGYIEPHAEPKTAALLNGLECLPTLTTEHNGITLTEFNLDAALRRKPSLLLVDELAHTNAPCCRHTKRFQDIEELLNAGIDVYTTVNVQHIESLNDTVASITGIMVNERIPDSVFDNASQVELVDIEPQELIERMKAGEVYRPAQARQAVGHFFTEENLTALREIALRRCADRVNMLTEAARLRNHNDYHTDEHILASPLYTVAWFSDAELLPSCRLHYIGTVQIEDDYKNRAGMYEYENGSIILKNCGQTQTWKHKFRSFGLKDMTIRDVLTTKHTPLSKPHHNPPFTTRAPESIDPDAIETIDISDRCYIMILKKRNTYTYTVMKSYFDDYFGKYYWAPASDVVPSGIYDTKEKAIQEAKEALAQV